MISRISYFIHLSTFTDGYDLTYGGICYTFHNVELTWHQATQACESEGAHLVDIEDTAENELIATHLQSMQIVSLRFINKA